MALNRRPDDWTEVTVAADALQSVPVLFAPSGPSSVRSVDPRPFGKRRGHGRAQPQGKALFRNQLQVNLAAVQGFEEASDPVTEVALLE